jgi:hypothetical protein
MTASAFSLTLTLPVDGFAVTAGRPAIGGLHGATRHYFCPHCMSWMFTRPEGMDWFVNLRATMLDDVSWFKPFVETWTSEKLHFAETGAVHSYAALPQMEEYEGLVKEYMAETA